ncbi:MAG: hypothetical protein ACI8P9_003473 [Parasphingorhabdus sp.]|jgi:hypothetical protein
MAGEADKKVAVATATAAKTESPTIRWDDSGMSTSYANVCNVSRTREEVTLLFGTNQTFSTENGQVQIKLSDRLIINPFAAKRLSLLLDNVIEQYETKFGSLSLDS